MFFFCFFIMNFIYLCIHWYYLSGTEFRKLHYWNASYYSFRFISLRRFNRFLRRLVQMASFAKLVLDIRPKGPFYLVLTTDAGRPVSPFTLTQVSSEKNCNASVSMQAFYYCLRRTSAIKSIFKLTKSQVIGAAWQSHFRDEF